MNSNKLNRTYPWEAQTPCSAISFSSRSRVKGQRSPKSK